jgi:hypothetical protein|uniref:Uncharacterized protein n=1 Tax=Eutreptiella gymnastica TaxID=73025 RepID=A0A7S4GDT6_9EUGL
MTQALKCDIRQLQVEFQGPKSSDNTWEQFVASNGLTYISIVCPFGIGRCQVHVPQELDALGVRFTGLRGLEGFEALSPGSTDKFEYRLPAEEKHLRLDQKDPDPINVALPSSLIDKCRGSTLTLHWVDFYR